MLTGSVSIDCSRSLDLAGINRAGGFEGIEVTSNCSIRAADSTLNFVK